MDAFALELELMEQFFFDSSGMTDQRVHHFIELLENLPVFLSGIGRQQVMHGANQLAAPPPAITQKPEVKRKMQGQHRQVLHVNYIRPGKRKPQHQGSGIDSAFQKLQQFAKPTRQSESAYYVQQAGTISDAAHGKAVWVEVVGDRAQMDGNIL